MNGSYFDFPYPIRRRSRIGPLRKAALAFGIILARSHVVPGATYLDERTQDNPRKAAPQARSSNGTSVREEFSID